MANLPAAKKSIRSDKRKAETNKSIKSNLKTLLKKFDTLLSSGKQQEASAILRNVMSALDKAAKKNVIKKNKASRKKAQLAKRLIKK